MDRTSPFREPTLSCPRCHATLAAQEASYCSGCHGAWISEQVLVERVATMQRAPAELEWTTETRATLPCLTCQAPMEPLAVFGVPIDRCRSHGFWFDRDELRQVLYASSQRPQPARERAGSGLGDEVADMAVGAVVVEAGSAVATSGAAEVAAGAAAGTAEVALEIAGGILEAIGELLGGLL